MHTYIGGDLLTCFLLCFEIEIDLPMYNDSPSPPQSKFLFLLSLNSLAKSHISCNVVNVIYLFLVFFKLYIFLSIIFLTKKFNFFFVNKCRFRIRSKSSFKDCSNFKEISHLFIFHIYTRCICNI